jgi:hypothetical protein
LPTSASTLYTGPITVSSSEPINAVAVQTGYTDSLVSQANYLINAGGKTINFPSGFAAGNLVLNGYSYLSGSNLVLVDGTGTGGPFGNAGFAVGDAWYPAPVPITAGFSTNFSLLFAGPGGGGHNDVGTAFVIHNPTPATASPGQYQAITGGVSTLGPCAQSFGYGCNNPAVSDGTSTTGGISNSVAITFNLGANSIGMYTNGAYPTGNDTAVSGITLGSNHLLTCAVSYNGTTLSLLLTDTITHATQTFSWTVNIPSIVGGSTAYAGFTSSNGFGYTTQEVTEWTL